MKRKIAILIFMVLAFSCFLVGCPSTAEKVTGIEILETQSKYAVGSTINYDNIKIKVSYDNNTTKESTVKELGATVVTSADTTKEGETSYTIQYEGFSATKNLTVVTYTIINYMAPSFWLDYQYNIKGSSFDDDSKFIDNTSIYEVGNVNKFIFIPVLEGIDATTSEPTTINQSIKTLTKVYLKNNGAYGNALEGNELSQYVSIDNNTYQFTEIAGGNTFKMEISLDTEAYILSSGLGNTTITIEFMVVDGGYNVYDQNGLAVMTDAFLESVWEEIFKKNTSNPLTLVADDKPLYQYVGNVDTLILHGSITLDASKMPSSYFWQQTDTGYLTAEGNITPVFEGKAKLVGSLKDGDGESHYNTQDYLDNNVSIADGNMQKGLYATTKCGLSGNYFDIKVPTVDNTNNTDKRFYSVVWFQSKTEPLAPLSHWSVFRMTKAKADIENGNECSITFKNCSMTGNMGKSENNTPAGMMMFNNCVDELIIENVIGTSFFANMTQDNYTYNGQEYAKGDNVIINSKFLDSYSNMVTSWRGYFTIKESVMKRAGGPLFVLMDGNRNNGETDDTKGPNVIVDTKSKLESFATGDENWFAQYNAQPLIAGLKTMDLLFNGYFEKTMLTTKSDKAYLNVIAIIIPDPSAIMNPPADNIEICGSFTQQNDNADVLCNYAMHNPVMTALKAQGLRTYVFQSGNNFAIANMAGGAPVLVNANGIELQQDFIQNGANSTIAQWKTTAMDTLCVYMAASLESARFPYFGAILGFGNMTTI